MAEYAWRDIQVTILGRVIEGILDIEYETDEEKKPIYGKGGKVKGIQRGNEKHTGSITLRQSEVSAMLTAVRQQKPNGTLRDIIFDVQIHYIKEGETDIEKDRIISAQFLKTVKGMKQGDTDMQRKLPFIAEDIQENI